ncbi:glycoside hydrolase family 3 N-terminal domain-containing protein [Flavivirga spongiicola]|uniref:beta-N-acetylhexosaminidase n=1 Tax=Flavivirga spongiicola TaxID=421621 RepID=A0ABU7XUB3_9FLAO|nr:glycoside hydrolase family 3 N-terminal domain-containing protein [Flavivirga sp. MEBiC05379]MDO5979097.1 glycoside hydrolase family 3 N-terminal domain-containing protein [Flavivirga sp. MEBiC05379]
MKKLIIASIFLAYITNYAQQEDPLLTHDIENQKEWVNSIMKNLTLDQKIGQLFMIQAYSNKDKKHTNFIKKMIKKHHIGGLIFMQGTPEKQVQLTNIYQLKSKTPLLIGFDGEWGLDMRLKNAFRYPWNMTLGAVQKGVLIEQFGKQLGEHCKRIGIHINFAPVVDINTNPKNPIIGNRSFGENKYNVAKKAIAFTKGMQSMGVLANAKHFPGHGDTSTDSHKTLPFLDFNLKRLDSIELYPYRQLFDSDLASVMIAHLNVPSLEPKKGVPTSISYKVVTELLKEKMNFNGLIFTDALNMKGAANYAKPGDIDLAAFLAGNDMLLIPEDVKEAVKKIKNALKNNLISEARLNQSVQKILKAKYLVGLNNFKPIKETEIRSDIITSKDKLLYRSLMKEAITLVKNDNVTLPIRDLAKAKIAYVKLGDSDHLSFMNTLKKYAQVDIISDKNLTGLLQKLKPYNTVIIGYHKSNKTPWKRFKMSEEELVWLQEISKGHKVILDVFASPYTLLDINDFSTIDAVLVSYQNSKVSQEISAQMIFGALETKGKLPVSIKNIFPEGTGITTSNLLRLSYSIPEAVDMDSKLLTKIDAVTKMVVDSTMAPGGQVLVARYGKVIYHKSFGYHTYNKKQKVKVTDLYDLASVTKILGGLPLIMKSEEMGLFNLNTRLGDLLPYLKGTNKDTITIKQALSHTGKIKPWIPYYLETIDTITKTPFNKYYSKVKSKDSSIKVAEDLYLINSYTDSIYKKIAEAPQRSEAGYKYSGLIFYLFKKYIKDTYHKEMDYLNNENFYKPLGATSLTYNPLKKFSKSEIVPSEIDDYYRNQTLQGHVHDMGAAMMNGVSGNAGLFANSNDIAKMMQMYLQAGYYGGKRYFEPKTIHKFNYRYYEKDSIRRGLGFDKPQLNPEDKASSKYATANSFGHSGFTGTYTWADPDTGLLYVFLSNRVYPTMANNKLGEQDIRTNILDLIYEAIIE